MKRVVRTTQPMASYLSVNLNQTSLRKKKALKYCDSLEVYDDHKSSDR